MTEAGHALVVIAPTYPDGSTTADDADLRIRSVAFPLYPSIRLALPDYRRVAGLLDAFSPHVVHVATEGPLGFLGRRYLFPAPVTRL